MVDATVTLYKDIGLDSNFNRTMYFTSKSQQTIWFNNIPANQRTTLTDVNYNKVQNSFYIHEQLGDVYGYTYVRLQDIDESGRTYYGFVSNVVLVDEETSRFDIVIDPIQTFMTEWELGNCMVAREHIDRWDTIGSEVKYVKPDSMGVNTYYDSQTPVDIGYEVTDNRRDICVGVVAFTSDRDYTTSNVAEATTKDRIYFALVPLDTSDIDAVHTMHVSYNVGGSGDAVTGDYNYPTFREFTSGNLPIQMNILPESIIGMWVLPLTGIPINISGDSINFFTNTVEQDYTVDGIPVEPIRIFVDKNGILPAEAKYVMNIVPLEDLVQAFNTGVEFNVTLEYPVKPENGDLATRNHEPAMYMFPYRQRYITNKDGAVLMTIPDVVFFDDGDSGRVYNSDLNTSTFPVRIYTNIKTTAPQNEIVFGDVSTRESTSKLGYEGAVALDTPVSVDVMNDEWYTYCRTQRDSDRRMMWTSIATNTINQMVFMGYGGALVGSRSNSGANDPMKGGKVDFGGVAGNLSSAMMKATGLAVGASLITSTVQGYSMWAQQEAKEQTIRNQPSQLLSMSDGTIPVVCGVNNYRIMQVSADDLTLDIAFNNFKYYGYRVDRMEVPNIQSRKYYNYICTSYTTIKGSLPANIKQDLVDIFEKGITFFHADNCNNTEYPKVSADGLEYENIERSLIS